ncbi:MAG TPA: Asp23/Gls24 family envelope stress response protein [Brevefilum sp.]|nr:Asp23/Gls24 family envelope stress response protein [Brevefilum sp.]
MNDQVSENDISNTTISPEVLHKITRLTTLSVQGVSRLASVNKCLAQVFAQENAQGAKVLVKDDIVYVDVYVVLFSDMNVRDISREIQERVSRAITEMVGLAVGGVNIHIMDIDFHA